MNFGSCSRVFVLFHILLLAGSRLLPAQGASIPPSLTLEQAIGLALELNPILAAAGSEIRASEGDRITAGKRLNPEFSLQFESVPLTATPGPFFDAQEITSRVDYEIETKGRRRLRIAMADQELDAKKFEYADQIRRMKLLVQRAFYQTILAKSNLESSKSILDQAERMISLNRIRYQQGDISALDLTRIEVEKLKFQDDFFQADLALRNAKSALLALLHAPDLSVDVEVVGTLQVDYRNSDPDLPPRAGLEELVQVALKQRPDLAARLREQTRAATGMQLQRAIRSPNLTVGAGYKRNLNENAVAFGVTLPLNIFNRNEGEIIRAEAEQQRVQHLQAALEKEIQLQVQTAHNAVDINHQRVEYIKTQQLKRAEDASRVTLESYSLGGATLLDYLDAQRTYRDALRIYNQALFDERISLYELSNSIAWGAR